MQEYDYIYLDSAATTPVDKTVLAAAMPYYGEVFFNPSSLHACGQSAAVAAENAREQCATAIGAKKNEIVFTSGGTEAINLALSYVKKSGKKRITVSAVEHDAVTEYCKCLAKDGYAVDTVVPNTDGIITPEALSSAVTEDTALVCVMTVNNIVGSIQSVAELAAVAHRKGALFFTDAVQAVNSLDLDVSAMGADMLAVSAHKFYAPKGIGFLYVRSGVSLEPVIVGGAQERGLRGGTVNVPAAVAMGKAVLSAQTDREKYVKHAKAVSSAFLNALSCGEPILCGGNKTDDIVSVVFDGVNGGRLAVALSCAGVCCSVGSACSAGSAVPPPTLIAMRVKNPDCSVRFSFGKYIDEKQADLAARTVNAAVEKLRGK